MVACVHLRVTPLRQLSTNHHPFSPAEERDFREMHRVDGSANEDVFFVEEVVVERKTDPKFVGEVEQDRDSTAIAARGEVLWDLLAHVTQDVVNAGNRRIEWNQIG